MSWERDIMSSFLTNYSGPRVGFPCPTTIHMKDTLSHGNEILCLGNEILRHGNEIKKITCPLGAAIGSLSSDS